MSQDDHPDDHPNPPEQQDNNQQDKPLRPTSPPSVDLSDIDVQGPLERSFDRKISSETADNNQSTIDDAQKVWLFELQHICDVLFMVLLLAGCIVLVCMLFL